MNKGPDKIEVIEPDSLSGRWTPTVREETLDLFAYFAKKGLDEEGCATIKSEAVNILSKCTSPQVEHGSVTGLAVGYVQSGKTMSYTTLAALARDNGYRVIIAITGTSVPLLGQGSDRLKEDLRLETRTDYRWQHFTNPTMEIRAAIENTLADWNDAVSAGTEPLTILITVMKHYTHLQSLIDLLSSLDMRGVPTLIIDDEADQASMNAKVRRGGETTTYQKLLGLRRVLPHHSFIQYTATPQAPLLINIIDVLSPEFTEILTPGKNYTGGKQFFVESSGLVKPISSSEIPSKDNVLREPPASLVEALQIFFLGVAIGLPTHEAKNRSMLIHPSRETGPHGQYFRWVTSIVDAWRRLLQLTDDDPDKIELFTEFKNAYDDLSATASVPPFDTLKPQLLRALRQTEILEVNATPGRTPHIEWRNFYGHILVGGQAMDRGFTVEGLTVTYMPRGSGVGNVDTIQQRARFFGYKRGYLGLCRVYLESEVEAAFRSYVTHEEDMRNRLLEHAASGKPLREWKRAFFLDPNFKPTRKSVHDLDYIQDMFSDDWFDPKSPHDPEEAVRKNREVVEAFTSSLSFVDDSGDARRTPEQRNKVAQEVPLRQAYEELLIKLTMMPPDDSQKYTGLLLQVQRYLEANPMVTCSVYLMSGGAIRERKINPNNEIAQLFQGSNANTGYPGARQIHDTGLTIQIYRLNIIDSDKRTIASDVPTVAIWVPSDMAEGWLIQDGNNQ